MVQILNAPPKPFSWSFSHVQNFETCGRKYYHQNVLKDVSDQTIHRTSGNDVHEFMASAMRGQPLPAHAKHWQRWVDEFNDGGPTYVERKMAFTERGEPCDFFDKDLKPWCRIVVDALKIRRYSAVMWDWKTGRMKPDKDQLLLYAVCLFINFPQLETIDAALVFLREDTGRHVPRNNCIYEIRITRDDARKFWKEYIVRVRNLERALRTGEFEPRPSGLCRAHCNVVDCEHNGRFGE